MKRTITLLVLGLLTTLCGLSAQNKDFNEKEIENLAAGILSDNYGLQRSSIYFAGYYKVAEVVNEVTEVMLTSDEPNIKILAALALYEIGKEEALNDFAQLVNNNQEDLKVRKMVKAIYDKWDNELRSGLIVASH
ncbi:MAG: HEAT repeat domain-containing protein [Melioribacteraceae bacterium]|nr:HEAT repeat domain-containing protein [Melioribacteraceae bacterium]